MKLIPDKLYFKIGEVAKLVGVKPYVLRYWESEFPHTTPSKRHNQQRVYTRQEVESIFQIHELLHAKKFTIKGARHRLEELKKEEKMAVKQAQMTLPMTEPAVPIKVLAELREQLVELQQAL